MDGHLTDAPFDDGRPPNSVHIRSNQQTHTHNQVTRYGKPHPVSYRFAERLLVHEARAIGLLPSQAPHEEHNHHDFPLKRVYVRCVCALDEGLLERFAFVPPAPTHQSPLPLYPQPQLLL